MMVMEEEEAWLVNWFEWNFYYDIFDAFVLLENGIRLREGETAISKDNRWLWRQYGRVLRGEKIYAADDWTERGFWKESKVGIQTKQSAAKNYDGGCGKLLDFYSWYSQPIAWAACIISSNKSYY